MSSFFPGNSTARLLTRVFLLWEKEARRRTLQEYSPGREKLRSRIISTREEFTSGVGLNASGGTFLIIRVLPME